MPCQDRCMRRPGPTDGPAEEVSDICKESGIPYVKCEVVNQTVIYKVYLKYHHSDIQNEFSMRISRIMILKK